MSNGIAKRQNEELNIMKLAAQRQLYSEVSNLELFIVLFTVIIPAYLALVLCIISRAENLDISSWLDLIVDKIPFNFCPDVSNISTVITAIACGLSIFALIFKNEINNSKKEKKILAATIQQEFDVNVYSMKWDRKLFGERKDLSAEIAEASQKIMNNEKEKKLLNDWYPKEADELPLECGIFACQKSNFSWDAKLRKRYKIFLQVILGGIIILLIIIFFHSSVQDFLCRGVLPVLSTLMWIKETKDNINNDLIFMNSISTPIYSTKMKTKEELAFIQRDIFEHRKSQTKIPDWFYKIHKNQDESRERRVMQIRLDDK